ncbi:MAG: HD domain-containing protein, partial [Bradyrhizobium sp.]
MVSATRPFVTLSHLRLWAQFNSTRAQKKHAPKQFRLELTAQSGDSDRMDSISDVSFDSAVPNMPWHVGRWPHREEVEMDDHAQANTLSERADALEEHMMHELEHIVIKSALFNLADGKLDDDTAAVLARNPGKYLIMKEDPRLPKMPEKPTLIDYFRCRFASTAHLLQSATHAKKAGHGEKVIMACLLHDIAVVGFIRADHGYWGAQLLEPYVDEEVSWAIRMHQPLRFFADESVGYAYPQNYVRMFGEDYKP